jgi:ubiquinone/menaquinone biosynthesis C-methylase UbiE
MAHHEHLGHGHGHGTGAGHEAFANADAVAAVLDDPARDEWQQPAEVFRAMQLAPAMTVADVGAGTGYFAARLARAMPTGQVIATDVEPDMVRYLVERARRENLQNMRAVLATPSSSGLTAQSVDRILVVHVWHHLAHRVDFARELGAALRPDGKLLIVDFNRGAQRGPPPDLRVSPEDLIAELEAAGLVARVSSVTLPDQYIVEAHRAP